MQAVIAIPENGTLLEHGGTEQALMQDVAGVPSLVRVLATAMRAGVDSVLIIWPAGVDSAIWVRCAESRLLRGLKVTRTLESHIWDPRKVASWAAVAPFLDCEFLWLPWNWITHKRALAGLPLLETRPQSWDFPVLLEKRAVLQTAEGPAEPQAEGVRITSPADVESAERFLVARSGKPTDGIYSKFNRFLCRPAVRTLTHTPVTPNEVTVGGLLVAIVAAALYARGSYIAYVAGAVLFFVSGLFDEVDGMLARLTFRESAFGTWFEGFVDNATYLLVFTGITVGLYRQRGERELIYGIALVAGCALSVAVIAWQRTLAAAPDRPHEYAGRMNHLLETDSNLVSRIARQIHIFIKKGIAVHYLLIFTVLGGLPLFLRIAAMGANLTWILTLYFNRRFFRRSSHTARADELTQTAHRRFV